MDMLARLTSHDQGIQMLGLDRKAPRNGSGAASGRECRHVAVWPLMKT